MCLLITGQSATIKSQLLNTTGLIADIYDSNSDGLGVMYVNREGLKTIKVLPKSALDFRKVVEQLPNDDRSVALHARMKTHGAIDLTNCHPYDIEPGVSALMHNGILHTGNKKDPTKSDTWHFVNDFLKSCRPDTLHDEAFIKLLGEYIDNNRFAIMTEDGRLSVVNRDQGIEHEGVWYSNTYAWEPSLLIPTYKKRHSSWGGTSFYPTTRRNVAGMHGGYYSDDEDDTWEAYYGRMEEQESDREMAGLTDAQVKEAMFADIDRAVEAIDAFDPTELAKVLDGPFAEQVIQSIIEDNHIAVYHKAKVDDLGHAVGTALLSWVGGEVDELVIHCEKGRSWAVADALIYWAVLTPYQELADADAEEVEHTPAVPKTRLHEMTEDEFASVEVDEYGVVRSLYAG